MFDKFFDCLNVNNFTTGYQKRKDFKLPYRSAHDFRLKVHCILVTSTGNCIFHVFKTKLMLLLTMQWLKETFLGYLSAWEKSVEERPGYSKMTKKMMLLSPETRLGLKITGTTYVYKLSRIFKNCSCSCSTVNSFVELVEFLFTIPGVKAFLSEKLCQDPLEKFFGCQRQRGRVNENPTAAQFYKNTQALRVVNSFCIGSVRGNCRGNKEAVNFDMENQPLPKRQRTKL